MKRTSVSETLRQAIIESGKTHYRIAKDIDVVSTSTLGRFMAGEAGLGSEKIDALCDYLDLVLVPKQAGKGAKTPQNKG